MVDLPADFWKISLEERTKHNASFAQLNPQNGFISGEQARGFFLKSNLPTNVLGQIWNLADLNKDGRLDNKEFSIACFIIKKVLTHPQGAAIVPAVIPNSLLIDPTSNPVTSPTSSLTSPPPQIVPLTTTTTTAASPPTFGSNVPLFQANFPPMSTQPLLGSAPNVNNPVSLPGAVRLPGLATAPLANNLATAPTATPNLFPSLLPTAPAVPTAFPVATAPPTLPPATFNANFASFNSNSTPNLPNPIAPIPQTTRTKYAQVFQSNDPSSTGFVSGQQAKTLLMQTGLPQNILAQIWNLADYDKDGKLSFEEFIIAFHLCDFAKAGNLLPSVLPVELQPQRSRSTSNATPVNTNLPISPDQSFNGIASLDAALAGAAATNKSIAASFEDKRRENFDRGNAVLEAKRQMLREQEEREKREREEKERIEHEKRQKIKEEQERRRQAEIEKQMERQRLLDLQREEERRKAIEQREAARNELIRQQRLEWEKQKKLELEAQKIKLQEQLSTLKAKDKNLEYDMQALNEKINSYQAKISDTQQKLTELNTRLDVTRKSYLLKQNEVELAEKELREYTQNLNRMAQEKLNLTEKQKSLTQDNPFAEQYRNDSAQLKQKQAIVQQLKSELENLEATINSTRTQSEISKHELESIRGDEVDIMKENNRLEKLLDLKRGFTTNSNKNQINKSESSNNFNINNNKSNLSNVKSSQSVNNLRSATPKDNYDALKDEIFKIQQTITSKSPANVLPTTTPPPINNDPFASSTTNGPATTTDWNNSFDQQITKQTTVDPFASFAGATNEPSPFDSNDPFASSNVAPATSTNGFDDVWSSTSKPAANATNVVSFDDAFGPSTTSGDDNWATTNNNPSSNNDSSWAAFDDESNRPSSVQNAISFFNANLNLQSPSGNSSSSNQNDPFSPGNKRISKVPPSQHVQTAQNIVKYRAMFAYDATREDELSIKEGDLINVDISVKTDEGWIWGESQGRTGVFPSAFAAKLSDLESIQEESNPIEAINNVQTTMMPTSQSQNNFNQTPQIQPISTIPNYHLSVYAYISNEIGDLNFREFELINVTDKNEDWLTGYVVGSGTDPVTNPLRTGIFPSNFVLKFNLPAEYIGKYTISMPGEPYISQNSGEMSIIPGETQFIAIKKISPDGKWSFGESHDINGQISKGWFPIQSATAIIDSGVPPLVYSPTSGNNKDSRLSSSPSPPLPPSYTILNSTSTSSFNAQDHLQSNNSGNAFVTSSTAANSTINSAATSSANIHTNRQSVIASTPAPQSNNHLNSSSSTNNLNTPAASTITSPSTTINSTLNTSASIVNQTNSINETVVSSATPSTTLANNTTTGASNKNETSSTMNTTNASLPNGVVDQVIALYDFQSTTPETISFNKDAIINILEKSGDWWMGEYNGKIGLLPFNYVQSIMKNGV